MTEPGRSATDNVLQKLQTPLQGTTLGAVVFVAFMVRGSIEDAIDASDRASQAVVDLRTDVVAMRSTVAQVQATQAAELKAALEAERKRNREETSRLERELEDVRTCLRSGRRRCEL